MKGQNRAIYSCDENYQVRTVGETLDDAAGEAFDKIGRALGLGYPAGKIMDDLAKQPMLFPSPQERALAMIFLFRFKDSHLRSDQKNSKALMKKTLLIFAQAFGRPWPPLYQNAPSKPALS